MEALLLHRLLYGEADRIVEALTRELGKVTLIARHAAKSRRRFGGVLDYFNCLDIRIRQGRGDLAFLEEAELVRSWEVVRADPGKAGIAFDVLDAMRRTLREGQPIPEKYDLLKDSLDRLEAGASGQAVLAAFRIRLVALAGLGPRWTQCLGCGREVGTGDRARWHVAWHRGGVFCEPCGERAGEGRLGGPVVSPPTLIWMERAASVGPRLVSNGASLKEVVQIALACFRFYF